ncbi:hypothetical protein RND81_06G244600 [Saponaria officinalis]|uniref:Cation-transporting P-type ATPase N-terminal domain-containing protein n=1 Tax=Saponaria officinalis TaxID=3572 RepID=A0AAW1KG09_SAPOF
MANTEIDLYDIPIEEALQKLGSSREGLTAEEAEERLRRFGRTNVVTIHKTCIARAKKFLVDFFRPMNSRLIASMIVVVYQSEQRPKLPWIPFIVYASVVNTSIYYHSMNNRVNSSINKLLASLAWKLKSVEVLRSGRWTKVHASELVSGDVIMIEPRIVVPANVRLLEGYSVLIDQGDPQSSLTGEPAQFIKQEGDAVCYGSCCEGGESKAVVVTTLAARCSSIKSVRSVVSNRDKYLDKVLTTIRNVTLCLTTVAVLVETIVMCAIEHRGFDSMINSLLVLVIGGIPVTLWWTTQNTISEGSNIKDLFRSKKGAVFKRMHVVKEMADMDVLCICLSGPFMPSSLHVLRDMIEVIADGVDANFLILMAARACQDVNHDAVDAAILGTLDNPEEVWSGIREVSFQSRIPAGRLTTIEYTDNDGKVHQVCKGDLQEILNLAHNKNSIAQRVERVAKFFRDGGWQPVAVAHQVTARDQWEVIGIVPLVCVPSYDNADILRNASDLGIDVKLVTEHKCEFIKQLQSQGHICGMIGQYGFDVDAVNKADIGIAGLRVSNSVRKASDVVFTTTGLDFLLQTVLTCRKISKRIKAYCTYTIATTIHNLLSFLLLALIWKFVVPPMLLLIFVILNDALNRAAYATYEVKPASVPDRWKLAEVLRTGILLGVYFASTTLLFFLAANCTDIFQEIFGMSSLKSNYPKLGTAMYLQISISSQQLALFTQSRHWSGGRQDMLYVFGHTNSLMVAVLIAVYANDNDYWPGISRIEWGWVGVIWFYNIIFYQVLLIIKPLIQKVALIRRRNIGGDRRPGSSMPTSGQMPPPIIPQEPQTAIIREPQTVIFIDAQTVIINSPQTVSISSDVQTTRDAPVESASTSPGYETATSSECWL